MYNQVAERVLAFGEKTALPWKASSKEGRKKNVKRLRLEILTTLKEQLEMSELKRMKSEDTEMKAESKNEKRSWSRIKEEPKLMMNNTIFHRE